MMKKNAGFELVSVIIIIVILGLVGFIGWRVYDANSNKSGETQSTAQNQQTNNPATPPVQKDPNEGYFVIKEWDVRLKLDSELQGLEYSLADKDGYSVAVFSTAELVKYGDSCSASQTSITPLGKIIRSKGTKEDAPFAITVYVAQVGDYYYQYISPQATCSDDKIAQSMQTKGITLFKEAIKTLELAQ